MTNTDLVDLALEQSFPASDPPAFMAGAVVVRACALPHADLKPLRRLASQRKRPGRSAQYSRSKVARRVAASALPLP